jgi:YD repeat-containing protein
VLAATTENDARGFDAKKAFFTGDYDHVNLFSGNLVVQIPVGQHYQVGPALSYQFKLVWNGTIWTGEEADNTNGTPAWIERATGTSNAGFGWQFSLGRYLNDPLDLDADGNVGYESPDGSVHSSGGDLRLRIRLVSDTRCEVDFPNGVTHVFEKPPAGGLFRLTEMHDLHNHWVRVAYAEANNQLTWTVTDSEERTHTITFVKKPHDRDRAQQPREKYMVSSAALASFGGNANYTFQYLDDHIAQRPCSHTMNLPVGIGGQKWIAPVTYLQSLTRPDGTAFTFDNKAIPTGGATACISAGSTNNGGRLAKMTLPTGGAVGWTYGWYSKPPSGGGTGTGTPQQDVYTGVTTRSLISPDGAALGTWTYENSSEGWGTTGVVPKKLTNTVTDPSGTRTIHYFSVDYAPPVDKRVWYGAPFSYVDEDPLTTGAKRYLATEVRGPLAAPALLRSTYVAYEATPRGIAQFGPNEPISTRTVYHDDLVGGTPRWTAVDKRDWDGFGHFRVVEEWNANWNNPSAAPAPSRTTTTNFNAGVTSIPADKPWLPDTYTTRVVEENGVRREQLACFDPATGQRTATLTKSGTTADGVLETFDYDDETGYLVSHVTGNAPAGSGASGICALTPSGPERYRVDHARRDLANGETLVRSRYHDVANDVPMPFFIGDQTVHRATGLVLESRTGADARGGLDVDADPQVPVTRFTYDLVGRLKTATPPGEAATQYDYTNATTSGGRFVGPTITATTLAGTEGSLQTHYLYDPFGRLVREKRLMADGSWSIRETTQNIQGWPTSTSEAQTLTGDLDLFVPSFKTEFKDHDPFGRPELIKAPDGEETTIKRFGIGRELRTLSVMTASGRAAITTLKEMDARGRVLRIVEDFDGNESDDPPSKSKALYGYDIADRLTSVALTADGVTQTRTFQYDGLGHLTSESHPESGTTTYTYDARGHVRSKTLASGQTVTYHYDPAERIKSVYANGLLQKELYYDRGNQNPDWSNGKLAYAIRHNRHVALGGDFTVKESFKYAELGGRLSSKTTTLHTGETFTDDYSYNTAGALSEFTYPVCAGCQAPVDPARKVVNRYSNGSVRAVSAIAGGATRWYTSPDEPITYHANGMVRTVRHANADGTKGPLYTREIADGMARPLSITVSDFCANVIETHPESATALVGTSIPLSVNAPTATTFQWYRGASGDTTNPVGDATSSYTVTVAEQPASFWVRVGNGKCTQDSVTATINAAACSPITQQPADSTIRPGETARLTVRVVTGADVQWYAGVKPDTSTPVSTLEEFDTPPLSVTTRYWARVRVPQSGCVVDTATVTVTVCEPPSITAPAQDATVPSAALVAVPLRLSVRATGTGLTYAWSSEFNGIRTPIAGAGPDVDFTPAATGRVVIRVVVASGCGAVVQERIVAILEVIDGTTKKTCRASWTLQLPELVETIRPTDAIKLPAMVRLDNPEHYEAGDTARVVFRWFRDGVTAYGNIVPMTIPGPGVATSPEYDLRFSGQAYVRVEAHVECSVVILGQHFERTSVLASQTYAVERGHCPVPEMAIHPTEVSLQEGKTAMVTADVPYPLARLQWYSGESGNTLAPLDGQTTRTLNVAEPGTYWLRAKTDCGTSRDSATILVSRAGSNGATACTPVRITRDPAGAEITAGTKVTLSVAATGAPSPTRFMWSTTPDTPVENGGPVFEPTPLKTTDYFVRVSNDCSGTASRIARIVVTACTDINNLVQPLDQSLPEWKDAAKTIRQEAELTVQATSVAPLRYQWYAGERGDRSVKAEGPTATTNRLLITEPVTQTYWVELFFDAPNTCAVASRTVRVSVCREPKITNPLPSEYLSNLPGMRQSFDFGVQGERVTYQWYEGPANDETRPLYSKTNALAVYPDVTTSYWVKVMTACDAPQSTPVQTFATRVSVCPDFRGAPVPASSMVTPNTTTTITAAVDRGDTIRWYFFDDAGLEKEITGQTSATLTTPPITKATTFFARATSGACTRTSAQVVVDVCQPRIPKVIGTPNGRSGGDVTLRVDTASGETHDWYSVVRGVTTFVTGGTQILVRPLETTEYFVRTKRGSCHADSPLLKITICYPNITTHPSGAMVNPGVGHPMSVAATGTGITYQWYEGQPGNTTNEVPGAKSDHYTAPARTATYFVRVTSPGLGCFTDSAAATVTLCATPSITTQPLSQIRGVNPATLTVAATGTDLTYQWYAGIAGDTSSPIANASPTPENLNVTPAVTTDYWVRVSGRCGSINSTTARVSVAPTVTLAATTGPITKGTSRVLMVQATGTFLTYQWYQRAGGYDTIVDGATANWYATPAINADSVYFCRVASGAATRDSAAATLTVCPPRTPRVVGTPNGRSGSDVNLTVDGAAGETYDWYSVVGSTRTFVGNGSSVTVRPLQTTDYWVRTRKADAQRDVLATATFGTHRALLFQDPVTGEPGYWLMFRGTRIAKGTIAYDGTSSPGTQWRLAAATSLFTNSTDVIFQNRTTGALQSWTLTLDGTQVRRVGSPAAIYPGWGDPQWQVVSAMPGAAPGQSVLFFQYAPTGLPAFWRLSGRDIITGGVALSGATLTTNDRLVTALQRRTDNVWGLVVQNRTTTALTFYGMNADLALAFQLSLGPLMGAPWQLATACDLTGDTVDDLVWHRPDNGDLYKWLLDGSLAVASGDVVDGCRADSAPITVTICYPNITTAPQGTSINAGASHAMSVAATGTPALTYQWYTGNPGDTSAPISGATSTSYTATPQTTTSYWVRVTSPGTGCHADSAAATVTVCRAPVIHVAPQAQNRARNNYHTLTVDASGDGLHYQWYEGAAGVTTKPVGNDSNSFTFYATATVSYWVRVSGTCGTVDSPAALQSVTPVITTQPVNASVCGSGSNASFSVVAEGAQGYQWYRQVPGGAAEAVGTSSASLTIPLTQSPTSVWCDVTSGAITVSSTKVAGTITGRPVINSFGYTSYYTNSYTLETSVTATGTVHYRFYEGALGDTSKLLQDSTTNYKTVSPVTVPAKYWVRAYYAPWSGCSSDAAITVP